MYVKNLCSHDNIKKTLFGVPVAIKDLFATDTKKYSDLATTSASNILSKYKSSFNSTVVDKLEAAGAIIVGKTNQDEFAMGTYGLNTVHGTPNRANSTQYVPGGSSSGSALAVAEGLVPVALGTDTGGSVRLPAAYNNIVGFKPSYGAISRYGAISYASSLDTVGIFANNVSDCISVFEAIRFKGGDAVRDLTAVEVGKAVESPADKLRVGYLTNFCLEETEGTEDTESANLLVEAALEICAGLGAEIQGFDIGVENICTLPAAYYCIATAEASSNLMRYDKVFTGDVETDATTLSKVKYEDQSVFLRGSLFHPEVQQRILMGSYVLSRNAYKQCYLSAIALRHSLVNSFDDIFKKSDFLVAPVSASPPPKVQDLLNLDDDDFLQEYLTDVFTCTFSLAGLPSISIPVKTLQGSECIGFSSVQIIGNYGKDLELLSFAKKIEELKTRKGT
eukprot:augustus_masked-scaffold_35-processed-gene-2.81-mRNA-1 protein AED:0.17 eAED:0.19 QI:0/-1/0/1/-1/1/1/0/449